MSDFEPKLIPGLLIEGTDFIGKTTLVERILQQHNHHSLQHRKCFLSASPVVRELSSWVDEVDLERRDYLLTASYFLDSLEEFDQQRLALQERYWLSQYTRNMFFHREKLGVLSKRILEHHHDFHAKVYLYSNITAKKERSSGRTPKGARDKLLASDPLLHQDFDDFSLEVIKHDKSWHIIDTSEMSREDVFSSVNRVLCDSVLVTEAI